MQGEEELEKGQLDGDEEGDGEDELEKGDVRSFCKRYVEKIQDMSPSNSEEKRAVDVLDGKDHKWMSRKILAAVRQKERLWKSVKAGVITQEYRKLNSKVKNIIRSAKRKMAKKLADGGVINLSMVTSNE